MKNLYFILYYQERIFTRRIQKTNHDETTAAAVAAAVALNYISEARNNLLLIFEKGRSQTKIRFSRLRLFDNDSIRYFSGISR